MEEATANKNITVAAIDLGSNTFRLLIAAIKGSGPAVLVKRNVTVKLGRGLVAGGELPFGSINTALAVLTEFKTDMARYNIACCRCCGTEALRKAANVESFLDSAAEVLGVEVEVVSGSEEASLSCRGALASMADKTIPYPLVIADVGSASTELIFIEEPFALPLSVSLPAGAAVFTELGGTGVLQSAFEAFSDGLRGFLAKLPANNGKISVIGTGGTATALAVLDLSLADYDEKKVHGHELMIDGIVQIRVIFAAMSDMARDFLPGLERGRGNILIAGLEIYQEILATIEVEGMIISDSGLLEGIMISCLERNQVPL